MNGVEIRGSFEQALRIFRRQIERDGVISRFKDAGIVRVLPGPLAYEASLTASFESEQRIFRD